MYENFYEKIVGALVENGYVVLENALDSTLAKELFNKAKNATNYKRAGVSASSALHLDETKRRDKILWLDNDGGCVSDYLSFSNGLKEYLNYSLSLGVNNFEAHFARYDSGDFYAKHLDAFKNSKNRVVTTVYYLNEAWEKEDGGELLVYDENDKLIKEILPKQNTLVVFMSAKFPHEVLPPRKERFSIAGWFRIDIR